MVQWLSLCTFNVGGASLIPGWGTKIWYVVQPKKKKKRSMSIQQPPLSSQVHALLKRFSASDRVEQWYRIKPPPPSTGPCKGPSCPEALPGAGLGSVHCAPWSGSSHCAVLTHILFCFPGYGSPVSVFPSWIHLSNLWSAESSEVLYEKANTTGHSKPRPATHTLSEMGVEPCAGTL